MMNSVFFRDDKDDDADADGSGSPSVVDVEPRESKYY